MNTSPPKIFNPKAQSFARRRSAKRQARNGLSFLYTRAAEDAASRLEDINRQFAKAVLVGEIDGRQTIERHLPNKRRPETFGYLKSPTDLSGSYDLILSIFELQSDDAIPETLIRLRIIAHCLSWRGDPHRVSAKPICRRSRDFGRRNGAHLPDG